MESLHADHLSTNEMCANMRICYEKVAGECLPSIRTARKPWISNIALQLISDRDVARAPHNHELEKHLTNSIKFAVKTDRTQWLNNMLAKGDWKEAFVPNKDAFKMARTLWKAISGQMC